MKKQALFFTAAALTLFMILSSEIRAQSQASVSPTTNGGKKWRIAYIEGGQYRDYQDIFRQFMDTLAEMGWLEKTSLPKPLNDTENKTAWSWLSTQAQSRYIEFVPDAFVSSDWDKELHKKNAEDLIARLNTKKDIDLILAFGTWAGQDTANSRHSVPTMLFSTSDPIRSGIVKSEKDSGYDHFHARLDPKRYERQIRLFHGILKFKKLGIVYQDTPDGRIYSSLDDAKTVANEAGFELVECVYPPHSPSQKAYSQEEENNILKCCQQLAPQIDAFYITSLTGITPKNLPKLLESMFKHKVATFSQRRTQEVKYGVLLSLAQENFKSLCRFHAEAFSRILNGKKPRELPMLFESPQEIAVNTETARKIGFRIPLDILAGAKEIYEHIEISEP